MRLGFRKAESLEACVLGEHKYGGLVKTVGGRGGERLQHGRETCFFKPEKYGQRAVLQTHAWYNESGCSGYPYFEETVHIVLGIF